MTAPTTREKADHAELGKPFAQQVAEHGKGQPFACDHCGLWPCHPADDKCPKCGARSAGHRGPEFNAPSKPNPEGLMLVQKVRRACEGRVWGFKPPLDAGEVLTVLDALLSEIAALRGEVASLEIRRDFFKHNMTQAECQRDEAVGLLREVCIIQNNGDLDARIFRLLANQGADQ